MNFGRMIARELARADKRTATFRRMQREAAARPGSVNVQTPSGGVWMTRIEVALYDAMRREGLSPFPQFYIQGYYADFAFPDVRVAVEAECVTSTIGSGIGFSAAPAGPSSGSTGRRSTTRPTTARTWSGGKSKVGGRWQRPLHVRRRSDDRLAETRWLDRSGNSPGC